MVVFGGGVEVCFGVDGCLCYVMWYIEQVVWFEFGECVFLGIGYLVVVVYE